MYKKILAVAAIAAAVLGAPSAKAAVHIHDLGVLPIASTNYVGVTGSGAFTDYFKFSIASNMVLSNVSFTDSVARPSHRITGGNLQLFNCATNCTGTLLAPTGSLISAGPILNPSPLSTSQFAALGPDLLVTAGAYFLKLSGNAPVVSVTYGGVINLSSAVPELDTWAMMLIGFAGLGFMASRRRQSLSAA